MTLASSYKIEHEILERFPTEKLEYYLYRTNKRGKLYAKCSNLKGSFKNSVQKYISPKSHKKTDSKKKARPEKQFSPEADAELCVRSLKFDNLSSEEFDNCWKACRQFRMDQIKNMENTAAVFDKWPFYKNPSGFRLIDMDFDALHETGDGFLSKWSSKRECILKFLSSENHIKDKNIKGFLDYIHKNDVTENSRDATILWAIHGYLVPTNRSVSKDLTGKKNVIKFTIKDSQDRSPLYSLASATKS